MDRRDFKTREFLTKAGPSVRVPRAETRLTVYRSLIVELFQVERACVKLDDVLVNFVKQMCL
jgi:hypothetical protein